MTKRELQALHTTRKSYYKKAYYTLGEDGTATLYSYGTKMLEIKPNGEEVGSWYGYSQTTNRHIKEFRTQFQNKEL